MQTKGNSLIVFAFGFIIGIALTMAAKHNAQFTPERIAMRTLAIENAENLKAAAAAARQQYAGKIDTLQTSNGRLAEKVKATQSELQRAKEGSKALAGLVGRLIAQPKEAKGPECPAASLAGSDTLQTVVQGLVANSNERGSLYEGLASSLNGEIANRGSVIGLQAQQYASLKMAFGQSIFQQQALKVQLGSYPTQLKKHRAKNRLLQAGVVVLCGITTYSLLHH